MKSVLPPALEAKRLAIARIHNRLVLALLASFILLFALCVAVFPRPWHSPALVLVGVAVFGVEFWALYRVIQYDKVLSRRYGFLCPYCQAPLYEPRGFINVTGLCPKCRRSVVEA
jgi:hypothetical protein